MSIALENVRRDTRIRPETDQMMSTGWIAVPLLEIAAIIVFIVAIVILVFDYIFTQPAGTIITAAGLFSSPGFRGLSVAFSFILLVLSILFAFMIYKLIKRRNTHFARQILLYEDLTHVAKELAAKKGVDVSLQLNSLERTLREARIEETEKNAVLWVILTFSAGLGALGLTSGLTLLPVLATLYIYYFLMKDFFKHERREDVFVEDLNRTLANAGLSANFPRRVSPVPDRSFVLYLVLTIVTVGFFWIYWVYTLLNDPNNHFRHQALTEEAFISQVAPVLA